jgi:hypothetical protein
MTETEETRRDNDQWDMLDSNTYWLPLPATTVDEYLSGETPSIFIRREGGSWWLSQSDENGASDYAKLEDAKVAGDKVIQQLYDDQVALITADIGVSPDEWEVELDDTMINLTSKLDGDILIDCFEYDGKPLWGFDGTVTANSVDFARILEIAKAEIKSSPAPR